MKYNAFVTLVQDNGWTVEQLRCDVPPSAELLLLMDRVGMEWYEKYVTRYEAEAK